MVRNFLSGAAVVLVFSVLAQAAHTSMNRAHPDILTPIDRTIRVCAKPGPCFTPADASPNGRNMGFLMDLLNEFTKTTGIKFEVESHPDWMYDRLNDDGTWDNTLIGGLLTDQCDMVGPDVTVNSDAEKVIDYLTPIMPYKLEVIYNPTFGLPDVEPIPQYLIQDTHDLVFLKETNNKTLHEIYRNIDAGRPSSIVDSDEDGVKMVSTGNFAYIIESNFVAKVMDKLGFPASTVALDTRDYGKYFYNTFAVQIGTKSEIGKDLRQDLDVALERLNEDGIVQQLLIKNRQGLEL